MSLTSITYVFFMSIPIQCFMVISTLIGAGYKELLSLKKVQNMLRLFSAVGGAVLCSFICHYFISSVAISSGIQCIINYLLIVFIYRLRVYSCLLSFIFTGFALMITQWIIFETYTVVFNMTYESIFSNASKAVILSLPERAVEILVIIIAFVKGVHLRVTKLNFDVFVYILLLSLIIIMSSFIISDNVLIEHKNNNSIVIGLMVDIIAIISFASFLIYKNIVSVGKKMLIKDKIHEFDLRSIRNLLSEGKADEVIKLIDLELKNRLVKNLKDNGFIKKQQ